MYMTRCGRRLLCVCATHGEARQGAEYAQSNSVQTIEPDIHGTPLLTFVCWACGKMETQCAVLNTDSVCDSRTREG